MPERDALEAELQRWADGRGLDPSLRRALVDVLRAQGQQLDELGSSDTIAPLPKVPDPTDAPSAPGIRLDLELSSAIATPAAADRPDASWTLYGAQPSPPRAAPPPDRRGKLLPQRYDDLGVIGTGGMGEVRRVRDRELGRVLAMKFIHPDLARHRPVVARFVEEAQITAQLQHPGIVPVYDLGVLPDHRAYFTMKEIEGRTLSDVIYEVHCAADRAETGGAWTFRRLMDAYHKICEAVAYAHARGVVHRDLKPGNIMVGAFGEVVVADWGLAKVVGRGEPGEEYPETDGMLTVETIRTGDRALATRAGGVAGTPAYMPPEQARGELGLVGPRSDVYALGALLYEILSGRPPYEGQLAEEVLAQVLAGPPPPPGRAFPGIGPAMASIAPRDGTLEALEALESPEAPPLETASSGLLVPQELRDLCQRAMARDPEERFPDARQLAAEVSAWLDGARKQEQAQILVERALALRPEAEQLRSLAADLRGQADRHLSTVRANEPVERKRRGWALQDEADRLEWQAELKEVEVTQLLRAALTYAPDQAQAHDLLAQDYRRRHDAAEASRDRLAAAYYEALLRPHDTGRHAAYLRGDGVLTIWTDPPGAEIELCVYERVERRLEAVPFRILGRAPLVDVPLPMGSYLLRIRAPGRVEVVYPVSINRGEHWDGMAPGGVDPHPILLPYPSQLGPQDCYVPAGWTWLGGDREAAGALPRRRVWLDGFVIQRFPITNQAYVAFLNALVADGREDEALLHVPRERSGSVRQEGAAIYGRNAAGRFVLRQDADGNFWGPTWPVASIDWASANAYARWVAARTRMPWRLPGELEREKAARGADGRFFPWGDFLDPTWCCMADTHLGRPSAAPVDAYPMDESPYGVQGLAGNIRDWCADIWTPQGPPLEGGRVVGYPPVATPTEAEVLRAVRGGSWDAGARSARSAGRPRQPAGRRGPDVGFRLARCLPEKS